MFKIIGGDGSQYGPVTVEQLREWIASGRANGQTMAQRDSETEWKPLSQFAELADALAAARPTMQSPPTGLPPTPPSPDPNLLVQEALSRPCEVNVGHCFGRAWEMLKADFWPLVGVSALILLVLSAAQGLLNGPLLGGLLWYYLRKIRRQSATINDAFAGFSAQFLPLFLGAIVSALLGAIGLMACLLPGIYLIVAWQLTLPLIQDKRLEFWDAMEVSRKVLTAHWWSVFLFSLACIGLNLLGALCCVGVFVTWPLTMIALAFLYEDLFGGNAKLTT